MVLIILYDCMILYDDINLIIISNTSVSHLFTGAMLIECHKTNTVQSQQIVKNVMKQKT